MIPCTALPCAPLNSCWFTSNRLTLHLHQPISTDTCRRHLNLHPIPAPARHPILSYPTTSHSISVQPVPVQPTPTKPAGCSALWQPRYAAIYWQLIDKYSAAVGLQLFGHMHSQESTDTSSHRISSHLISSHRISSHRMAPRLISSH